MKRRPEIEEIRTTEMVMMISGGFCELQSSLKSKFYSLENSKKEKKTNFSSNQHDCMFIFCELLTFAPPEHNAFI